MNILPILFSMSALAATSWFACAILAPQPTQAGSNANCPASNFMSVQAHPANSVYPAPTLSVSCTITAFVVNSNGIPNFEFVQITPNALQAQTYRWTIPLTPTAGMTRAVALVGSIGVAVSGLPIFGPTEAPNMGSRDPFLDGILDFCNGHTAQRGDYHLHVRPACLLATLNAGTPGAVIGYAFDGVPILTPTVCANSACSLTSTLRSSWAVVDTSKSNAWQKHGYVAGSGDLDECNGGLTSAGTYAYFATPNFPYFMGCTRGTVPAGTPVFQTTAIRNSTPRTFLPMLARPE